MFADPENSSKVLFRIEIVDMDGTTMYAAVREDHPRFLIVDSNPIEAAKSGVRALDFLKNMYDNLKES